MRSVKVKRITDTPKRSAAVSGYIFSGAADIYTFSVGVIKGYP